MVGWCKWFFTKFNYLRRWVWTPESHQVPRPSPEMDVSRWVDIRNAQAHCLTPTELRERARQRSSRNRKFPWIWRKYHQNHCKNVQNPLSPLIRMRISKNTSCFFWFFFHIDFRDSKKHPPRIRLLNTFALAKNNQFLKISCFSMKKCFCRVIHQKIYSRSTSNLYCIGLG